MLSSVTRQTQSTHVRIDWPVKGRSVSFVCKTKQLYKVPQKRKTKQYNNCTMYCKTNNNCTRYHKRERQSNTTTVQCTTKQITTVKHSKKVRQKTCTMYYTSKRQNNMMYLIHSDVIKFFRYVWFSSNTPFSFDSKTYGRDITQIIVDKESINTNNSKE
jgi:hypothetical protein